MNFPPFLTVILESLTNSFPILSFILTVSKFPVQAAVLDGFGDVGGADILFTGEVRDGAGYFDNAVVRPHGKSQGIKSAAEKIAGFPVEGTKFLDVAARHGGVILN